MVRRRLTEQFQLFCMKMAHKRNVDPELEILRKELAGPANMNSTILEIERLSAKIHAAYLFEKEGTSILQKICLFISSTPTGKTYSGWQHFGAHLDLTREQLQCIEYDFKGLQDPTYYVLLTFVQSVDATMDRIFQALQKMDRFDIIHRLSESLKLFMDFLNMNAQSNDFSRPKFIPRAPLVLSPIIPLTVLNIERLSSKIHTAYLFEKQGIPVLQKICDLISSTPAGRTYSGWQDFGSHLGITKAQLQCIENDLQGLHDPAYYVLLTFVQSDDATMDKIFGALQRMNRLDVVEGISEPLTLFMNGLNKNCQSVDVLKPKSKPNVPLVLSPIAPMERPASSASMQLFPSIDIHSPINDLTAHKRKSQNYGSIVMLTFTGDGQKTAHNIARIFREKNPKIGVLILQEQAKLVYSRAEEFIDDCYKQVDYVIPILTKGYLERINNSGNCCYRFDENSLDSKYLNYIFSLLRFEYVKNDCCNYKVRCLVTDIDVTTVIKSDLHPTLQAWFRTSDINDFATNILLRKF